MKRLTALLSGLLFGFGLLISGMTDPEKVLGFLDVAGAWDPSLALVMAGAIGAALGPFTFIKGHNSSLLKEPLQLPTQTRLDRRLVLGSLTFGVGWGLAGVCPGPALLGVTAGYWQALLFVAAMLVGMAIFEIAQRRRSQGASRPGGALLRKH